MPLPLDTWRESIGLQPWHFWGFADSGAGAIVPINSNCSGLVYEYDWQGSDAAGRESIREAIQTAEWKMAEYVGYRPMPTYTDHALVDWPRPYVSNQVWWGDSDATWRRTAVQAPEGYVLEMGIEALTLIGTATVLGGELVYSALFNPSLEDTFTITIATTVTDPTEIAVYFAAADRWDGSDASERWRIEPIQVVISGGNAVITGRKWLCGKPILYQNPVANAAPLNPQSSANFVTSLDVYQRTTNGNGNSVSTCQATLVYETSNCAGWWGPCWCATGTSSSDPGTVGEVIARAGIRDKVLGLVTPGAASYDAAAGTWSSQWCCSGFCAPDRVELRYLAGYPLEGRAMARRFRDPVAWLASAELKRRICACRETNEKLWQLQQDLTLQATETERYQISQRDMDNPFGMRRGHIQAWKAVQDMVQRRGISV